MSKRIIRNTIVLLFIMLVVVVTIYAVLHPTHYKYCDYWIIGRSIDEVEERYGKFDVKTSVSAGCYVYTNDSGIMPDYLDHYYFMWYDENGIVYDVFVGAQLGG